MTKVIFRKYPEGEILAIFPEYPGNTWDVGTCGVYQHLGMHGYGDYYGMIDSTVPAKPEEYADLLAELKGIGYDDLEIRQRSSPAMVEARRKALER